ncbi:MAG: Enoyl-CoA hydratase [uncultured Rubrobacteraceae bacterium]|uniref:Enoyl-CoA hydratase n=1 Tax=uncultured Rubrobacteraceae bacterium TaxID=349277 RepID=A0A6J4R608_9ACTN|nr:MAG: Enoyl-CoA hydratase [uncultured Rubrobacteraceae bacterium]
MTEPSGLRKTLEEGGIFLVELNRPEKRNALDETLQGELLDVLQEAAVDGDVRGIILTGSGEAFSAGGDLSRFERDWDPAEFRAQSHELTRLISAVERIEKPVVAAINGLATGAGTQLALSCDLRVASEKARFLLREGMVGLIPSHGGTSRLVKLVGLARARDIVLGGEDLDASEAFRHGIITRVVSHEGLLDEARDRLRHIFRRAPQAYGLAKRLLHLSASVDLESGLFAESLAQSSLVQTADHKEGVRAARERRAPAFEGR